MERSPWQKHQNTRLWICTFQHRVSHDHADLFYLQWDQRLLTFDTQAINYILVQAPAMFPKPWQSQRLVANLFGNGVLIAEGLI